VVEAIETTKKPFGGHEQVDVADEKRGYKASIRGKKSRKRPGKIKTPIWVPRRRGKGCGPSSEGTENMKGPKGGNGALGIQSRKT